MCYTVVQCCSGEKIHIGGCLFASPAVYYHRLCYGYCITGDLPASICYSAVQCVAVSQATAGFTVSFILVSTTQVPALAQVNYTQVTYPGPGTGNFSWSRSTVLAQVNSTQVTYPGPGKLFLAQVNSSLLCTRLSPSVHYSRLPPQERCDIYCTKVFPAPMSWETHFQPNFKGTNQHYPTWTN